MPILGANLALLFKINCRQEVSEIIFALSTQNLAFISSEHRSHPLQYSLGRVRKCSQCDNYQVMQNWCQGRQRPGQGPL